MTVLVANGTSVTDAAAYFTQELKAQGWNMQPAEDTTSSVAATAVYYAPGQQQQATAVAAALGVGAGAVQAFSSAAPVPNMTGLDVVVVVGPDLASKMSPTTTTTASS